MNKWMVRLWGFVALGALLALIVTTVWSGEPPLVPYLGRADPPQDVRPGMPPGVPVPRTGRRLDATPIAPDPGLSMSAAAGFFRVADPAIIEELVQRAHVRLRTAAGTQPDAMRAADVLLLRGYNSIEVERLLLRHRLDYLSCETKTPVSDGTTMTMWSFVNKPYGRLPLSIAELVEMDIEQARQRFLAQARIDSDPQRAARQREIAGSRQIGVYRIEVVGAQQNLVELIGEADVRAVVAEIDGQRAQSFEQIKRRMPAAVPVIRTRGPFEGDAP